MRKKILILGTSIGSVDIVKYAQSKGIYTYVADYLVKEQSAAKLVCDEDVLINTAEVDTLIAFAKKHLINAIFAGVSEFNLESARKISNSLGFPFYYTSEQWQLFMNKKSFRGLCMKYNVGVPETYFSGNKDDLLNFDGEKISYPVIVKPIDNQANIGISVCYDKLLLQYAISHAMAYSASHSIIIEQFIEGIEISCTYVVKNGKCRLVCMGDKYAYENENHLKALSNAYIYPSSHLDEYLEKEDGNVQRMIMAAGLNNSTVFFQGIYSDHKFYLFEAGLRLEGTASYRITEAMTGQNFMKFLVDTLLQENTTFDIEKADPTFGGKHCVIFSQISKGGIISEIKGLEDIKKEPSIISFEQRHQIGTKIEEDGTLHQILFRYVIKNDTFSKIIEIIKWLQKTIKALDQNGNNMIIDSFNPDTLHI